ncbi:hypothetical protein [Silvimonas amylolytica]|uniref:hypothetical protein n=1 Tax=Silvimonas amylolytica TaxID=449663 RepID=UPI00166B9647|nr:hypothetical protein [Silvimonas amylolytica]
MKQKVTLFLACLLSLLAIAARLFWPLPPLAPVLSATPDTARLSAAYPAWLKSHGASGAAAVASAARDRP